MKKTIFYFSTIMIVALLCLNSGCIDDDKSPLEQLPPATQAGLNTFGCLVNGEVWMPGGNVGAPNLDLSYDPGYKGGAMVLSAYRTKNYLQDMTIAADSVAETGIYKFNSVDNPAALYYDEKGCYYDKTEYNISGFLNIARIDLTNQIISGTFEFTLAKPECDTIRVTDGRFDMKI